jgi:protein AbiQ
MRLLTLSASPLIKANFNIGCSPTFKWGLYFGVRFLTPFCLGENMSLSFYYIDKEYAEYLQSQETKHRGFSHVPNMEYDSTRNQKFILGIVLNINGYDYYAPVSSYTKQQPDNILINIEGDATNKIKGSIRFNYMFPVPKILVTELIIKNETDFEKRNLLNKELNFCLDNEQRIINKARQTYSKVTNKFNDNIAKNSCDFKLLETVCEAYKLIIEAASANE